MAKLDTTLKPISIVAFVLTCLGCVQALVAIFLTDWWSKGRTHYGVWSSEYCTSTGECESQSATELEGGQEALFISKVFATFTAILSLVGLVLHIVYAIIRLALIRTVAIFLLGAAGLFGLLCIFVFIGFYNTVDSGSPSIGAAFVVFVLATIFCLVAACFTAWAAVRKATSVDLTTSVDD